MMFGPHSSCVSVNGSSQTWDCVWYHISRNQWRNEFRWCNPSVLFWDVSDTVSKDLYINHLFLAILRVRDLFGMVSSRDLFKGCERDLQLFESPSMAIHILSHGTKFYVPAVSLAEIVSNYKMCSWISMKNSNLRPTPCFVWYWKNPAKLIELQIEFHQQPFKHVFRYHDFLGAWFCLYLGEHDSQFDLRIFFGKNWLQIDLNMLPQVANHPHTMGLIYFPTSY